MPLGSLGSYSVVGFTLMRRWVLSWLLASALGVIGFTRICPRVRWVLRVRWFHSHTPCPGGRWGSLGSLGSVLRVAGFIRGPWVHSYALSWSLSSSVIIRFSLRWDHPGSLGSLWCNLGVVFLSGIVEFTRVRSGGS